MILILILLSTGLLFGQADDPATDTFVRRLKERKPQFAQRIEERFPGATPAQITEHALHYRRPGWRAGKGVAVFGSRLAYVDPDTGELKVRAPELWETDNGWALKGADARARIVNRPGIGKSDVGVFTKVDGQWVGFGMRLPEVTYTGEDFLFTFAGQWNLRLGHHGFDLFTDPIAAAQGKKNYSFPYITRGLTVAPDASGDLAADNGWKITRAKMIRADGQVTFCGPWITQGARSSATSPPARSTPRPSSPES